MKKVKSRKLFLIIILAIALISATSASFLFEPGITIAKPIGPYLNGVFPSSTPQSGNINNSISYSTENAFPNLTFVDPVDMLELPGGNEFLVLGLQGQIWKVANDRNATSKQLLLDVSDNVVVNTDGGMLGFTLHPQYGQTGSPNSEYIYIFYRYTPVQGTDFGSSRVNGYMRLSRFNLPVGANQINPSSEYVMINIFDRHDWHNGGDMFFHPDDKFLYLVVGDEGGANDEYDTTQQIDKWLFSGVLRIDVDQRGGSTSHPIRKQPINKGTPPAGWPNSFTQGYYIPNDNPWLDTSGRYLEEFYAIGTRSPHRMTIDPPTGDIWIGDIGQFGREEIDIVRKADNLQWPYREGEIATSTLKPSPLIGNDRPPIYTYPRSVGTCVIGGVVYRGNKFPELNQKYIFGDHETQDVWTITKTGENNGDANFLLNVPKEGVGTKDGISSFFADTNGDLYILDLFGTGQDGGKIRRIVRNESNVADPPEKLSELGVFKNLATLEPIDGIVPYDVNTPLWSDGAEKKRWIALPNDGSHNSSSEQIVFSEEENWSFPSGTVVIKHFELPRNDNNPTDAIRLETRFLVFTENSDVYAVTYKWNEQQSDAFLIRTDEQISQTYRVIENNTAVDKKWDFPTRSQCIQCHNSIAGYALGLKTRQLNKTILYPSGIQSNQLETWNHLNMFDHNIPEHNELPALSNLNELNATNEIKIRSYIDANCAFCHRPNGVEGAFDARALTALYDQSIVNEDVESHSSTPGAKIIKPGDPSNSILYARSTTSGSQKMPPIGRNEIDQKYVQLLNLWIDGLNTENPVTIQEGLYSLEVRHSGKYLAIENESTSSDANAVQISSNSLESAHWFIEERGNGKYRIRAKHSNLVLVPKDLRTSRGSRVIQEQWNGSQHQLWYFKQTGSNGYFRIANAYNGLELNLEGNVDTENQATVLWSPGNSENQLWKPQIISSTPPPPPPSPCGTETELSALNWTSASAYGNVRKNTNRYGNGPLTIQGTVYQHGLSAHARSEITYNIQGRYERFTALVGIDDTAAENSAASVQFEIIGDGASLYISPTKRGDQGATAVDVDISGVNTLTLVANPLEAIYSDHADWAMATLIECSDTTQTSFLKTISPLSNFYFKDLQTNKETHEIKLSWEIENDSDIVSYEVQRSANGSDFVKLNDQLGLRQTGKLKYSSLDYDPVMGRSIYRIMAIDTRGQTFYSKEVNVDFRASDSRILVYPNPVRIGEKLTVDVISDKPDELSITIYSADGRRLHTRKKQMIEIQSFEQFDISGFWSGVYMIEVKGSDWRQTKRFIVK